MFSFAGGGSPPFGIAVSRASECVLAALAVASVNVLFSSSISARNYLGS